MAFWCFGILLVAVPGLSLLHDQNLYDVMRLFAMVAGGIILALHLVTVVWTFRNLSWRSSFGPPDRPATLLVLGATSRLLGTLILLIEAITATAQRLGEDHLTPRTPIFMFACLLLLMGWGMIDRQIYRQSRTPQEIVASVVQKTEEHLDHLSEEQNDPRA